MQDERIEAFWAAFIKESGRGGDAVLSEAYHFCSTEELANSLLQLVLAGKKRATASLAAAYAYEGEPLPRPGRLSILTDWHGAPHCVIENTEVTVLPFRDMTWDLCKREGEDDSLASWQASHIKAFEMDLQDMDKPFSWDMPVVFEEFRVIYPPAYAAFDARTAD